MGAVTRIFHPRVAADDLQEWFDKKAAVAAKRDPDMMTQGDLHCIYSFYVDHNIIYDSFQEARYRCGVRRGEAIAVKYRGNPGYGRRKGPIKWAVIADCPN